MQIFSIAVLVVSAFMLAEAKQGLSNRFCRFLYIWNGDFQSVQRGNSEKAFISLKPIKLPGDRSPARYYTEVSTDLTRSFVLTAAESDDGELIHTKVYKVHPEKSDDFKNLELTPCGATFKETEEGVFEGEWIDCTRKVNGKHPVYHFYAGCKDAIYEVSQGDGQSTVDFSRVTRYDEVQNPYNTCVDPCGN